MISDGIENNTLKLLLEGWSGLWIEANDRYVASIRERFSEVIEGGRLSIANSFVTAESINRLICPFATGEIDLISIDIDGNDYYVLEALSVVQARVIVIEYNGKFPPPISIAPEYVPDRVWAGTDYMGASLEALVSLASRRGYYLVCCNFPGANAFFVRKDLVGNNFQAPFSAENHFQPARNYLWQLYVAGHPPDWGRYTAIPASYDVTATS